ncbi:MAG: NnrS family protein [Gammaproteobacteria bacterium]|nr:NnrS family protein [Gammaproteobacteria bacterium]NNJ92425.1 NnrS family protein [Gammaproteobacteria bacterium]
MPLIQPEQSQPIKTPPILRLGFRPFFYLAGLSGILLISIWLYSFFRGFSPSPHYTATLWHAHEMVFGYTAAAIAGFLLTAVKNWTDIQTLRGYWLGEIVTVWLAARILPFLDLHPLFAASVSVAFFPFLAIAIGIPLIKSQNKTNWLFIPAMLLIGAGDLFFQLSILGLIDMPAMFGINFSLHIVIILVVLMGGRVIPFFISRGTNTEIRPLSRNIEILTYLSLTLWLIFSVLIDTAEQLTAIIAGFAAIMQIFRLYRWHIKKLWSIPMLWILYLGYCWIVIGLLLQASHPLFPSLPSISTHALTSGAIGMITLGMMSRVSLGHTARQINHTGLLLIAFILMASTPVTRVIWPLLFIEHYQYTIVISGTLWLFTFLLFTAVYTPVLWKARIDGKDG